MKYTRLIAILLVSVMLLGTFAACNSSSNNDGTEKPTEGTSKPTTNDGTENNGTTDNNTDNEATEGTDDVTDVTDKPTEKPTDGNDEVVTPDTSKLVLFADGEYKAIVVRKDDADDDDKDAFSSLRAIFKNAVGKMPPSDTDFDEKSATSPAVIIGQTKIAESVTVYESIKTGEAAAKFVNGKYVLAYTSVKGYIKLLQAVDSKVKAYVAENPGEIVIDPSWNIKLSKADIMGYDSEMLSSYLDLPEYNGKTFDKSDIDLGQSSVMHIAQNTNFDEYEQFVYDMESSGFILYTENQIGDNHYSTFLTESQIVNVMFFANKNETRVTVDSSDEYGLPGLESDNIYKETSDPSLTVLGIGTSGYPGGMGYVYKLSDGRFFIIDGGITRQEQCSNPAECSAEWLYHTLRELADDPDNIVIAGWLLTHIHNDHLGAFINMAEMKKCTDIMTVEKVIYSQPNDAHLKHVGKEYRKVWMPDAINLWRPAEVVKAHPGQVFYFADVKLTILGSQDLVLPGDIDSHNNMSVVSKVEFMDYEALYLADAEGLLNEQLETIYGKELQSDIIQLAHHGYNNTNADAVYELADPMIVFWPVSSEEYRNCDLEDVWFNKRFFEPGISNYVAGETNMTITDFASWIPDERWDAMP